MKNLATLSLITSVAGACDVKQDLGDTATTGESSGGSTGNGSTGNGSNGTTGGGDTGVLDTGPWDDSGPWETTTGFADMGEDTGTETGVGPDMCGTSSQMDWDSSALAPEALGFGGTFVGVGACEAVLGEVLNVPKDSGGGTEVTLALACTLSGTRDGADFVDEAISIDLGFSSFSDVGGLLPSFWPTVTARFVVESAGFDQGASRYVVLEQPMLPNDADAPVLIATSALDVEPNAATYTGWYDEPWFGQPSINVVDASCSTGDAPTCGFDVALQAGWLDRTPSVGHGGQAIEVPAPTEGGTFDLFIGTAWQAPQSFKCGEDFPSANFDFVGVGTTPS